jgi:RNA recognition motif-containing protein
VGTRLYVGNLSYDSTENDLREHFGQAGSVAECEVMRDRFTDRPRGFAFVEMASQEEANKAIEQFNGQDFMGRPLTVNEARPRGERSFGDFGGGGGGHGDFHDRGPGDPGGKRRKASGKGSRRGIRNAKRESGYF